MSPPALAAEPIVRMVKLELGQWCESLPRFLIHQGNFRSEELWSAFLPAVAVGNRQMKQLKQLQSGKPGKLPVSQHFSY